MCVRSAERASAVYRSRHSEPPVQRTMQFNREMGRNPEDGQTEADHVVAHTDPTMVKPSCRGGGPGSQSIPDKQNTNIGTMYRWMILSAGRAYVVDIQS